MITTARKTTGIVRRSAMARKTNSTTTYPNQLVLKCFAPEGTPIQGKTYVVGPGPATLGRKQTNSISFSDNVKGVIVWLDSSISGEHATINLRKGGGLEVADGCHGKSSTNGTWLRLSAMHETSESGPLTSGTEMLIGTIRFVVSVEDQFVERNVNKEEAEMARLGQQQGRKAGHLHTDSETDNSGDEAEGDRGRDGGGRRESGEPSYDDDDGGNNTGDDDDGELRETTEGSGRVDESVLRRRRRSRVCLRQEILEHNEMLQKAACGSNTTPL